MKASQIMIALRAEGKGYAEMLAAVKAFEAATKPKRVRRVMPVYPKPDDVDDALWASFVELRAHKKAPITEIAMNGIRREADKLGWTLTEAITEMIENNWQGFKAEWVTRNGNGNGNRAGSAGRGGGYGDGSRTTGAVFGAFPQLCDGDSHHTF
jgi:hypothetical protein